MKKILPAIFLLGAFSFSVFVFAASPTGLAITADRQSSCAVSLSMVPDPSAISYVVQYSTLPVSNPNFTAGGQAVPGYDGQATEFSHTGLSPDTKIKYRYKAIFDGSESGWFESGTVTTGSFGVPSIPTNVRGSGYDGGRGVQIDWSAVAFSANGETGYELQRKRDNGAWTDLGGVPAELNSYNDGPNLTPASVYSHRVRSFQNDSGCSASQTKQSGWVEIKTPTMPADFSVDYLFGAGNPPIEVSWSPSSGADFYRLTGTKTLGGNTVQLSIADQTDTNYVVANPDDETTYKFSVRGCTSTSCSAPTNEGNVLVDNSPNDFVARVFYIDGQNKEARLSFSWLDNLKNGASEPGYRLEKTVNGSASTISPSLVFRSPRSQNGPVEAFENVQLNKNYSYRVQATLSGKDSEFSPVSSLNTNVKYILRGAAWSGYKNKDNPSGLGWLVMNSDGVEGLAANKKWNVSIQQDGYLSGVAWAEASNTAGYGWLSFNRGDLVGCPDSNPTDCAAKMDASGQIRGWARFLGLKGTDYEWVSLSSEKISGGVRAAESKPDKESALVLLWDLVKTPDGNTFLEKLASRVGNLFKIAFAATEVEYGLELKPNKEVVGEVWNPKLGWIIFTNPRDGEVACELIVGEDEKGTSSCLVTADTLNLPPSVVNVLVEEPTLGELGDSNREGKFWCAEIPTYKVSWVYSDPDNDPQASAQIVIRRSSDNVVVTTINRSAGELILKDGRHYIITRELGNPLLHEKLGPSSELYATVQATDSRGLVSEVSTPSPSVITAASQYPLLGVTQDPIPAKVNLSVKYAASVSRISGSPNSYSWEFKNGSPATSDKVNPSVIFSAPVTDTKAYHLIVIKDGLQCGLWGGNVEDGTDKPPRYLEEN